MSQDEPIQEGRAAALVGKTLQDCPYEFDKDNRWFGWMEGWHSVHRVEMQRSWPITVGHLQAAKAELPVNLPSIEDGWSIERFEDCLSHNELELAFDELEGIGNEIKASHQFWKRLLAAAENMELTEQAIRCRRKLAKEGEL